MSEAIIGLLGVVVGTLIAGFKEWWFYRAERKTHAHYLAIRIVCVLDEYLEQCIAIASDDGEYRSNGTLRPSVEKSGPPVYPKDIDWKSIDHKLMYKALSLPNKVLAADRSIGLAADIASPPEYDEVFEERHIQYSRIGLLTLEIIKGFRARYGIEELERGGFEYEDFFSEKITDTKVAKARSRQRAIRTFDEINKKTEAKRDAGPNS